MLATQRMSSQGGQQNFPFGCMAHPRLPQLHGACADVHLIDQQENIHGLGLPEFMTPGPPPPPGQPLLNAHENQDLDNFFQDFDQNAAAAKPFPPANFNMPMGHDQYYGMPPMFVGSETAMGPRSVIDPQQLQGGLFPYGDGMIGHDMNTLGQPNPLGHPLHAHAYNDPAFQNTIMAQIQSAASVQPSFVPGWPQSFVPQNAMDIQQRGPQVVNFGTDARFQPTGYAAPNNPMDPDIPQALSINPMDWFEPTSASTTQPNTQPSSPNWSKKRNFDDFQQDQPPRNGFAPTPNGQQLGVVQPSPPHPNSHRKRSTAVKKESGKSSQPLTPLSTSKSHTPLNAQVLRAGDLGDHEDDAEAEEEDEDAAAAAEHRKSPSPAPWPASRARPPRNTKAPPPPKPSKRKKDGAHSSASLKPKSRIQRASSDGSPTSNSTRVPLSLDQKKANHTSSEQRRRDATARAYAELYDLVPELDELGKQSTMKKLEVVVAKVRRVKQRVEELRSQLGIEVVSGRTIKTGDAGWHR